MNTKQKLETEPANINKITLPTDCLIEILPCLVDDKTTLFSASLVNRAWCRIAIPLLWSTINVNSNKTSLIKTFLKCMNDNEREAIIEYSEPSYPRPLFLYTSYIKELDWNTIDDLFVEYEKGNIRESNDSEKSLWKSILQITDEREKQKIITDFMVQICTLIFRTATSLEKFVIDIDRTPFTILPFAKFPNASVAFSKLKEVQLIGFRGVMCHSSLYIRDSVHLMKSVSSNIRFLAVHLSIYQYNTYDRDALCDLIKAQNQLEHVILTGMCDDHRSIIHALHTQAKCLACLEFKTAYISNWTTFLLNNLGIFTKLEALAFKNCYLTPNALIGQLTSQPPSCLRKLYIGNDEKFLVLLEIAGRNLEDLIIVEDCTEAAYRAIGKHCTNLLSLQTNPTKSSNPSLLEVITKLPNLKHLSITNLYRIKEIFSDEFWTELSQKSSANLCSLYFNCLEATPRALASFLSNRTKLIKVLEFGGQVQLTDEHLLAILNYCQERQVFVKIYSQAFKRMGEFDSYLIEQLKEWVRLVPNKRFDRYSPFMGIRENILEATISCM
ncbi:2056_t:CDS:1 [Ambispora gerdemannii]|uniref:2056_t:CDS:1 n=1 Tax=Ambispora gerdemannii TaxID=144530 RepID=A0A9N9A0Y0_9GLOM|nr:2056_t:CDS:1 [Ambispora gerdemannii]